MKVEWAIRHVPSKETKVSSMMAQVVTFHVMLSNVKLTSNLATNASFHALSIY